MAWFDSLYPGDGFLLECFNLILQITLLGTAAILIGTCVRFSPAMRYAVFSLTLLLIAASPLSVLLRRQTSEIPRLTIALPELERANNSYTSAHDFVDRNSIAISSTRENQINSESSLATSSALATASVQQSMSRQLSNQQVTSELPANSTSVGWFRRTIIAAGLIWIVGTFVLAIRLILSLIAVSRLRRVAMPITDARFELHLSKLHTSNSRPMLLSSTQISGPLACGFFRPAILIPESWLNEMDEEAISQVLIHESAHVARRDGYVVLLQHFVQTLYWFHPLVRTLNRLCSQAREEVCDNYVLAASVAPCYGRTLLQLAYKVRSNNGLPGTVGFLTTHWRLEQRIAGMLDERRDISTRLSKRTWAMSTILGLSLLCLTSIAAFGIADGPTAEPSTATETTLQAPEQVEKQQTIKIIGKVLESDGSPTVGVPLAVVGSVAVRKDSSLESRQAPPGRVLATAESNSEGRFEIVVEDIVAEEYWGASLIAKTSKSAFAGAMLDLHENEVEKNLSLQPTIPVKLRFIDLEGTAASDLAIDVATVMTKPAEGHDFIEGFILSIDRDLPMFSSTKLITDSDGAVTLPILASNQAAILSIAGTEQFAPQQIAINTGMPEQRPETDQTYRWLVRNVQPGSEAMIPLAPAQIFTGVVFLGDTDRPAANADISIWSSQQSSFGSMTTVSGKTDAEGRFRLSPQPGVRFGIQALPPAGEPYQSVDLRDLTWSSSTPDEDIVIRLPAGVLARGKVINGETGQPIKGAQIQYQPNFQNPNLSDDFLYGWQHVEFTNDDGEFAISVLSGKGMLAVHGGKGTNYVLQNMGSGEMRGGRKGGSRAYAHAFMPIDMTGIKADESKTINLQPGREVNVQFVGPDGTPVKDALYTSTIEIDPLNLNYTGWPQEIVARQNDAPRSRSRKRISTDRFFAR